MTIDPGPDGVVSERATTALTPEQIEAMCPADPDIMHAFLGDIRGLREVQAAARARRDELDRKYPGLRVS